MILILVVLASILKLCYGKDYCIHFSVLLYKDNIMKSVDLPDFAFRRRGCEYVGYVTFEKI